MQEVIRQEFLGVTAVVASRPMRELYDMVTRVASTNASVLVTGESGSGKELVARAIHQLSHRTNKPWVDISCASLPEHLVESELFGYEKGAFSGAMTSKPGLFELAHQGTIFLDEVGELEPRMQVKLLRVLDGSPYFRLGGTRKITTDVRVVAATNRPLDRASALCAPSGRGAPVLLRSNCPQITCLVSARCHCQRPRKKKRTSSRPVRAVISSEGAKTLRPIGMTNLTVV